MDSRRDVKNSISNLCKPQDTESLSLSEADQIFVMGAEQTLLWGSVLRNEVSCHLCGFKSESTRHGLCWCPALDDVTDSSLRGGRDLMTIFWSNVAELRVAVKLIKVFLGCIQQ